jgi:hypothetical protein
MRGILQFIRTLLEIELDAKTQYLRMVIYREKQAHTMRTTV